MPKFATTYTNTKINPFQAAAAEIRLNAAVAAAASLDERRWAAYYKLVPRETTRDFDAAAWSACCAMIEEEEKNVNAEKWAAWDVVAPFRRHAYPRYR